MNFKLCLLALVMLFASPAWAGWVYLSKDVKGNVFYLDFETLRKDGNLRRIWQMVELADGDKLKWVSTRYRNEYDCKNETRRMLSFASFSQKNLSGETLFENTKPTDAEDIAPGSIDWTTLKLVCSK